IIITDNTELYKVESKCTRCNNIQEKIVEQQKVIPTKTEFQNSPCPSCNAANIETNGQDIVDYLALLAAKTGTKIEVISGNTEHGLMLGSIGKVGAILRYNPNYSS
ncbi:MAG: peptide chain release factor 1, partial [Candidatus Nitrosopelagicus sp.]|nr:peptide chain release factor 1 [Candidatus Nitrosopelagicus sp.]